MRDQLDVQFLASDFRSEPLGTRSISPCPDDQCHFLAGIDSLEAQQRVRVTTRLGQKGPMAERVELL